VSREGQARRIVARAMYGGGAGLGLLGGTVGLLWAQTLLARRRVGLPRGEPFAVDGRYEPAAGASDRPPWTLAVLGDSGAAGLGADTPDDTMAVVVARGLADASGRPVELVNLAVVGARTVDVLPQVDRLLGPHSPAGADGPSRAPDVVVVMAGANDVTHRVRPTTSVRLLDAVVTRLVGAGSTVVWACCPDLGTVEPVPNPLRHLGRRLSRTLAAAQALATVRAGGRPVELGAILGPEFASSPREYFSEDGFHPSSLGYRRAGEVVLPVVLEAVGLADLTEPA
jgi:lysophospholipase L1-like esterase